MNHSEQLPICPTEEPADKPTAGSAGHWTALATAVQFLTRVPLRRVPAPAAGTLSRSAVFFPLVGTLIGMVTAGVLGAGCLLWPVWLAVLVALAVEACLTGALHEDGMADFFDAFGGGWTRHEVLAILKDSRLGTYGALALLLAVLLRAGAIHAIVSETGAANWPVWGAVVIASSTIGRWFLVLTMVCIPPVRRRESLARDMADQLSWRALWFGSLWALPAVVGFAVLQPQHFGLAVLLLGLTFLWFRRGVQRKLGGTTGDCLGCICYVSQVVVLLAAAARLERWI